MMRPKFGVLGGAACLTVVALSAFAVSAQRSKTESRMADAAKAFLATLDAAQKQKAQFPFTSEERVKWGFVPSEILAWKHREGVTLKQMTAAQRKAALELLRVSLSDKGNEKATGIRSLEYVLLDQEKGKGPLRDAENYYFTVYGEPSDSGTWGWRYEGHHCSQNFTVVKGKTVVGSPEFFGTNPAEVRTEVKDGPPKGTRILAGEEDLGRAVVASLSDDQKKVAILNAVAPADIATGNTRQAAIQEDTGIAYKDLSKDQQGKLRALLQEYCNNMPAAQAAQRMDGIKKAGMDNVKFAWLGSIEKGQGHYYRVQGSTFLIEYDNTQNGANHVHSVWRDFKGDFGADLLAMHYQQSPHRIAAAK